MTPKEIQRLLHKLQEHQIELETQNEELRLTQQELAESRDRYFLLYDFAPAGYVTLDASGAILEANLTLATMLGVNRGQLVGRKFTRSVTRNMQDTLHLHQNAVRSSDVKQTCDLCLRRADGTTLSVQMETIGLRHTVSGDWYSLSAISDITERQHLEMEILNISERERMRLGMELHDDLAQQLSGLHLFASVHHNQLKSESHPSVDLAGELKAYVHKAMSTARNLSKSVFPIELEQGGLMPALGDLAHRTEQQTQVRCQFHADEDFWIEKDSAIHLYRIVQESIGNAIKHAQASLIRIECRVKANLRTVLISDDGIGLESSWTQAQWSTGMGMHLFQYRARLIGATLVVGLPSSGRGCQVSCSLPVAKPHLFLAFEKGLKRP